MLNYNDYANDKRALIAKTENVKNSISELRDMGIDASETLKKLDNAIKMIGDDKISVVLVGAFSDGKTSVIAGWLNEKVDNMKISSDESSDEILCYTPSSVPDGCRIIDTPGLFGDKKGADENGGKILLSDKTKKFISEANLILYVVTAKNPIKDTHKDCIRWILKDLNKLTSTVFVINRMDDVADLTDDEDFALQARIKTENLKKKLIECEIGESEASRVNVVCISADPNGRGIDAWNAHREEYLRRSHLCALEKMTNSVLKDCGKDLITKTGCDILNDEVNKFIKDICERERKISEIIPDREESLRRNEKDLVSLKKRICNNKRDMINALNDLEKRKRNKIRAASLESFKDVMEDEIGIIKGEEGYVLNDEINGIFSEYAEKNSNMTQALSEKFQVEYDRQNEVINALLKQGANGAAGGLKHMGGMGTAALKDGIFAGRELLGKVGVTVKFKPWQVTKLAKFAEKALPIIGAAIDVVSNIVENALAQKKNKKFEESKNEVNEEIHNIFLEIKKKFESDEQYVKEFAPSYLELERQIDAERKSVEEQKEYLKRFSEWRENFTEVDFGEI